MKLIFGGGRRRDRKRSVLDKNNVVKHKIIGFPHLSYIYFEIKMARYFTVYIFLNFIFFLNFI